MLVRHVRRVLILSLALAAIALTLTFTITTAPTARAQSTGDGWVWWEGESTTDTNFSRQTWLSGNSIENADRLSEGDWLTNDGPRHGAELYARWDVDVPDRGEYQFWTRKFWHHGPFRWRFGNDDWQTVDDSFALADSVDLRLHVGANWVNCGKVDLSRGTATLEIRLLAAEGANGIACFDCFLLTQQAFVPRGKLKPGERSGLAADGWWAFEPGHDAFDDECPIDLRYLNEKVAGEKGFVESKKGQFVLGNGDEARFWAVNAGPGIINMDHASIDYLARRLAKLGVNMVRYHGPMFDRNARDPAEIDTQRLDNLHYFVHAMKQQGIYTKLSFFFPLWFDVRPGIGIDGYDDNQNKHTFALLYFNPRMQEIWKAWAKALLKTRNPYTKKSLADEPAVAIIELINEDSFLFWTMSRGTVAPTQWTMLEELFGKWAAAKHGSIDRAIQAWGGRREQRDDSNAGRVHLFDIWHLTGDGSQQGNRQRLSDQLRFFVETQRDCYDDFVEYVRDDLDSKSLISCSNWHTADARVLDALERYTYMAGDVIDKHGYFGGRHEGDRASYAVSQGDRFDDRSGLRSPANLPIQFNQFIDYPHIISEIGWPNPNRFKAEFPVLCAAYGSLQDADGFYFFALGGAHWDTSVSKFPLNVPTVMGQFPACALMYRRGDIKVGDTVVHEALTLEGQFDFQGSAAVASVNLDELRRRDANGQAMSGGRVNQVDPLAFYVGRVTRELDGRTAAKIEDLSKYIDRARQTVTSETGELAWDHGRGVVRIDAPNVQGAVGFLRGQTIELGDVTIACDNEYASVLVISLDGKPIKSSAKLLVQVMTEEQLYGWRTNGDTIAALGSFPLNVRDAAVTVTLTNSNKKLKTVTILDENGDERDSSRLKLNDKKPEIECPADAVYIVVD